MYEKVRLVATGHRVLSEEEETTPFVVVVVVVIIRGEYSERSVVNVGDEI